MWDEWGGEGGDGIVFIGIRMQCVHTINTRSVLQYRGEGVGVGAGGWRLERLSSLSADYKSGTMLFWCLDCNASLQLYAVL